MGELNTDVVQMQNPRNQQMADFLDLFGLVDFFDHSRQQGSSPAQSDVVA